MRVKEIDPGYITVDEANTMIESYQASKIDHPDDLNSLSVDAGLLRDYLADDSIKKVKIAFAHSMLYITEGHAGEYAGMNCDALTIVIAGYDNDGNYIYKNGNMVANHALPCPRNCPDKGDASSSLLL